MHCHGNNANVRYTALTHALKPYKLCKKLAPALWMYKTRKIYTAHTWCEWLLQVEDRSVLG